MLGSGVPASSGATGLLGTLSICSFAAVSQRRIRTYAHGRSPSPRRILRTPAKGPCSVIPRAQAYAKTGTIGIATGRADVAAWLEKAGSGETAAPQLLGELEELLLGVHPTDSSPCLNQWGFTVDDALVLPYLRNLKPSAAELEQWPSTVVAFLEMTSERCKVPLLA